MKRVLIAYFSPTGVTEQMAEFIAEGVRFSGNGAVSRKIEDIAAADLIGYDGYIFGSPTYSLDIPKSMKTFLKMMEKANTAGKPVGAFGSYTHDVGYTHESHAPAIIFNNLQRDCTMKPFKLGALILKEGLLASREGMNVCQDYGKVFAEELDSAT